MKRTHAILAGATLVAVAGALTPLSSPVSADVVVSRSAAAAEAGTDEMPQDLGQVVGAIVATAQDAPNYAGEWLDEQARTLVVYGVGEPGADLQTVMGAAGEVGLDVTWQPAEHSFAELESAGAAMIADGSATSIGYANDGSSLTATYDPTKTTARDRSRAQRSADLVADRTAARVGRRSARAGIDVDVDTARSASSSGAAESSDRSTDDGVAVAWEAVEGPVAVVADSRNNDTAPFDGGIRIVRPNGGGCSAGFPVNNAAGIAGMVTAAHCSSWGAVDVVWRSTGSGAIVGASRPRQTLPWDAQYLQRDASTYAKHVFIGDVNTTGKRVLANGPLPAIGALVRISGGYSGTQRGRITGRRTPNYSDTPAGVSMGSFYEVQSTDLNVAIAGNGDSGSPVVQYYNGGLAAPVGIFSGFLTGSSYVRPCQGIPTGGGRSCSNTALVSPWARVESGLNVTLRAGAVMSVFEFED